MTIEYVPTLDDVFRLKQALHRRAVANPLRWSILFGGAGIALGGAMMALTASQVWWTLAVAGTAFAAAAWAAGRMNRPTLARVSDEYAARAWLRDPFRVEVDADGLRYEHGPYRSRAAWSAFTGLLETETHLILLERRAPGALAYGLAKRALEKAPGGAAAWRNFFHSTLANARQNARS